MTKTQCNSIFLYGGASKNNILSTILSILSGSQQGHPRGLVPLLCLFAIPPALPTLLIRNCDGILLLLSLLLLLLLLLSMVFFADLLVVTLSLLLELWATVSASAVLEEYDVVWNASAGFFPVTCSQPVPCDPSKE